MRTIKKSLMILVLAVAVQVSTPQIADAQCAMCSLTAQNATEGGNSQGKGLNNGILFLLAIPYTAALGIGILWYTRYRTKKNVRMDDGPISLN